MDTPAQGSAAVWGHASVAWHARWMARWMVAVERLRGRGLGLGAVLFGCGIGLYLGLWREPPAGAVYLATLGALVGAGLGLWGPEAGRLPARGVALFAAGFALAALRTAWVAAPVLPFEHYGPVEGRIVRVDRGESGALRLTLDRVLLPDVAPGVTPARVRISLSGTEPGGIVALDVEPIPGLHVMTTAFLSPPMGPAEPGGFDYRRMAWFEGLGAVGYTRTPVLARAPPDPGPGLWVTRVRLGMAAAIRGEGGSQARAFVAAVLTGDRSGISPETTEALRQTNLSHLLAISGLHMGLLTGAVYAAARLVLALWPWAALVLPTRKIAAALALAAAAAYLALSGGNVATQRAFVMAGAMLVAVLLDRRALSIRTIAVAAFIVLVLRPEALVSAGFQMSFAATLALVAAYAALRDWRLARADRRRPSRLARLGAPFTGAAASSLIAGLATAPIAAAHFGRFAEYGLIANLVAVPMMGLVIMPAAVLAAVLWPLGLQGLGLWIMEQGARWILWVAEGIARWDGAERLIAQPPGWVLPLMALGGLWVALWPGRARLAGVVPMLVAAVAWAMVERPVGLIARDGALVGLRVVTPDAGLSPWRTLSRARGAGFTAENWAEADADPAPQAEAAARPGRVPVEGGARLASGGVAVTHLHGQRGRAALAGACTGGALIVTDFTPRDPVAGGDGACRVLDPRALAATGALALGRDGVWRPTDPPDRPRPWVRRR